MTTRWYPSDKPYRMKVSNTGTSVSTSPSFEYFPTTSTIPAYMEDIRESSATGGDIHDKYYHVSTKQKLKDFLDELAENGMMDIFMEIEDTKREHIFNQMCEEWIKFKETGKRSFTIEEVDNEQGV